MQLCSRKTQHLQYAKGKLFFLYEKNIYIYSLFFKRSNLQLDFFSRTIYSYGGKLALGHGATCNKMFIFDLQLTLVCILL